MKTSVRLAGTLALVAALNMVMTPFPATAQQLSWQSIPLTMFSLETRRTDLERRIIDGVASGRLTRAEGDSLRRELDLISDKERSMRADGTLSLWESFQIALELDRLSSKIESQMRDRQTALDDIDDRQLAVERAIAEGVAAGRLTADDAAQFRSEANRIADLEARYRRSGGGTLTYTETLALSTELDRLASQIERRLRTRRVPRPDIDALKADINARIEEGVASGRLTATETAELRREYNRISALEATARASGGGLSLDEALALAVELEKLSGKVEQAMSDATVVWPGIDRRKTDLLRRIDQGVSSGRLVPREAEELRRELNRIIAIERQFRADGQLSAEESLTLAADLDRLTRNLERQLRDRQISWSGIDARQEELDRRMADELAAGRLTVAEARQLREEFDRIAAQEARYRAAGGGLSYDESLNLALSLDRLTSQLNAQVRERRQKWPGIADSLRELDSKVADGVISGRLTSVEADRLRQELARIRNSQRTYASGGLSYTEVLSLALDIERLQGRLERGLRDDLSGRQGINARQVELSARIRDGRAAGTLTVNEADRLNDELSRVAAMEQSFRRSGRQLTLDEAMTLHRELDRIGQRLDREIRDRQLGVAQIEAKKAEVSAKLRQAALSGRLAPDRVDALKKDFDQIIQREETFRRSDGVFTDNEKTNLAGDLDRLSRKIDEAFGDKSGTAWQDVDARQAQLEKRLRDGIARRKINPGQAHQIRRELRRIADLEVGFKKDGKLSYWQTVSLARMLDEVSQRLDSAWRN